MTPKRAGAAAEAPVATTQYVIRAATIDDAAGIAEAHVVSWKTCYRGLLPQSLLDGLSVEQRTVQWQRSLQNGDCLVHVATDPAGHVLGFIATGPSRDNDADGTVGELFALYLRRQYWDLGIGSALHDRGVAELALRFAKVTLWVLDGNARGRAFYERQGWRPDGTVKHDDLEGNEAVEVRYQRRP